jgi:phospholipid/cholesterol/gamma-HCH transport system substrate-binding protein
MEKTTNQKIQLGLFVIIGLLFFILAIYYIGNKQNMFKATAHLTAEFKNINGLQLGNNVRYSGVNIGTVKGIEMINDSIIQIDMVVDDAILRHIKTDAIASIGSDGLVGNMIINIAPGIGNFPSVKDGYKIKTESRVKTEDLLKTLSVTNENAAQLTSDLLKITKEINEGKGTVGLLLKDTIMGSDLKETMYYLKISSKETSETVTNLNKLVASLDNKNNVIGVLKDTAVANHIKSIVDNLEKSSTKIDKVVTDLNATIINIKDGKGALNYLSNDPKLVKKIDSTMTNINQASFRLNENLEALKHNFLFKGYFKKQEKAKAKATKASQKK